MKTSMKQNKNVSASVSELGGEDHKSKHNAKSRNEIRYPVCIKEHKRTSMSSSRP